MVGGGLNGGLGDGGLGGGMLVGCKRGNLIGGVTHEIALYDSAGIQQHIQWSCQ